MRVFKYKALDNEGNIVKASNEFENRASFEEYIKDNKLYLISYKIIEESELLNFFQRKKLTTRELLSFFIHMNQLVASGVTLLETIDDIKETAKSKQVKNIASYIYSEIKDGKLLSQSMEHYHNIFDNIIIGLISSGEKTGNLEKSLLTIIEHIKWHDNLKNNIIKSSRYPLISLCLIISIVIFMASIIFPKILDLILLIADDQELPITTRSLIGFSNFMKSNLLIIILLSIITFISYNICFRMPKTRLYIDQFKLHIPVISNIIIKINMVRFCHFFLLNFQSGYSVIQSIENSCGTLSNEYLKYSILNSKRYIEDGEYISDALARVKYCTPLVIRMFKIGEYTGSLDKSLINVKLFYDSEIKDAIATLTAMIQPTITVLMGAIILWLISGIFGPIYSSIANVNL